MNLDDKIDKMTRMHNEQIECLREDNRLFLIALKLSGRMEELTDEAAKMIKKHGMIKAMKLSRYKKLSE